MKIHRMRQRREKGGAQTQAVGVTKGGPEVAKSKRSLTNSVGPGSLSSHRATPADFAMEPAQSDPGVSKLITDKGYDTSLTRASVSADSRGEMARPGPCVAARRIRASPTQPRDCRACLPRVAAHTARSRRSRRSRDIRASSAPGRSGPPPDPTREIPTIPHITPAPAVFGVNQEAILPVTRCKHARSLLRGLCIAHNTIATAMVPRTGGWLCRQLSEPPIRSVFRSPDRGSRR